MPSTRKREATERRSKRSDVMSDLENLDVMLGGFPENDLDNEPENEPDVDSTSAGLQESTDTLKKDFRSLLKNSSRGNSVIAIETVRAINENLILR